MNKRTSGVGMIKMNEVAINGNGKLAEVVKLPAFMSESPKLSDEDISKRSWIFRRLSDLGMVTETMANAPIKPNGFYINWSTITSLIAVLIFIGGLYSWTYNLAYQQGKSDAEKIVILERLDKAEENAARAERFQIVNDKESERIAKEKEKKK